MKNLRKVKFKKSINGKTIEILGWFHGFFADDNSTSDGNVIRRSYARVEDLQGYVHDVNPCDITFSQNPINAAPEIAVLRQANQALQQRRDAIQDELEEEKKANAFLQSYIEAHQYDSDAAEIKGAEQERMRQLMNDN